MMSKKTGSDLKIVAMIPARMGSTRLAMKNLALLCGKPLIYYAVNAAKRSGIFDRIVLNSESEAFEAIAGRYGCEFYKRPADLGGSDTRSDPVVYDFIKHNPCDIVVWVNSISPLQSAEEVKGAVGHFLDEALDSLITVKEEQVHCIWKGAPVNYRADEIFAKTQDLEPIQCFVYSLMMWRTATFVKSYEEKGYAFFCGKFGTYPVSRASSVIIKREEDLALASHILHSASKGGFKLRYDRAAKLRKAVKQ
jgi:CMP-N-acetylneuraminic acid synthetase